MGDVYKVTDGELTYYGSTTTDLMTRLRSHRANGNTCETRRMNKETMTIELVETVNEVDNLKVREKWFVKNCECINKFSPITTQAEKVIQQKIRSQRHYEADKQKMIDRVNEWRKTHKVSNEQYLCDCGSRINRLEKRRHEKSKKHKLFELTRERQPSS